MLWDNGRQYNLCGAHGPPYDTQQHLEIGFTYVTSLHKQIPLNLKISLFFISVNSLASS